MSFTGSGGAAYSSQRDNWETPPDLFKRCNSIWHFNLDAASSDTNALCERHFTVKDNGLKQDWGGVSKPCLV